MSAMLIFGEGRGSGKHPALDTRTFVDGRRLGGHDDDVIGGRTMFRACSSSSSHVRV